MIKQIENDKKTDKYLKLLSSGINHLWNNSEGIGIDKFVINTLEILMLLEREEYLKQLNLVNKDMFDKGNGSYLRSFKSLSKNNLTINIPRTRSGEFKPLVIEILKQNQEQINELALLLYQKGLSTRDTSDIMKKFFNEDISYATISNLASNFSELRALWENSKLDEYYKVIYCDAIYMTLRRDDSYSKEAVHIIYGVKENNKRELLSLEVNPTESSNSWDLYLQKLQNRGIKKIDLIVADGLQGLEGKIHYIFPQADFQKCVIHKIRSILLGTRPKDKEELSEDIKNVFDNFDKNSTIKKAQEKLENFILKWKIKYPQIRRYFNEGVIDYYFTYILYHQDVRRMIYTTNSIENLNKQIRKSTKNKLSFEKYDRLLDYVFMVIKDFEEKNWLRHPVYLYKKWGKIK